VKAALDADNDGLVLLIAHHGAPAASASAFCYLLLLLGRALLRRDGLDARDMSRRNDAHAAGVLTAGPWARWESAN